MEFGIGYFPTHDAVKPGTFARLVEDTYDLFVGLTAAAEATSRLRVGSGICLVIERDPINTAKEVASIDHLSGGRFEFGVGAGWNREEMANHGTDPRVRMKVLQERVEAMKAIWTEDEASYHGKYVDFDRIWSWPKPAQKPHPPVLIGGYGPTVLDRVLALGDAWFPSYGPRICLSAWPSCAPAPTERFPSWRWAFPRTRRCSSHCRRRASRGSRTGSRRAITASSRPRSSAGRRRSRSSTARRESN